MSNKPQYIYLTSYETNKKDVKIPIFNLCLPLGDFEKDNKGGTILYLDSGEEFNVKESSQEIDNLLSEIKIKYLKLNK